MGRVEGKVAITTGSTYGIGEAVARVLAKEGAISIVTGRSQEDGRRVEQEIVSAGGRAEYYPLDVTDEARVEEVARSVYGKYGRIDILVNNAGIAGLNKATHEYSRAEWEHVFDVNVTGAFLCTKHVVPYMQKQKQGNIIYVSSIYGIIGAPDIPAYHGTKAANREAAKVDALFYAKDNIRVNSVHPGAIWTPLLENLLQDTSKVSGLSVDEVRALFAAKSPLGRIGEPDDIAYGVLYLVSDEAKFVTGTELVIDGGYTSQ